MKTLQLSTQIDLEIQNPLAEQQKKIYEQFSALLEDPESEAQKDEVGELVAEAHARLQQLDNSAHAAMIQTLLTDVNDALKQCHPLVHLFTEDEKEELRNNSLASRPVIAVHNQLADLISASKAHFILDDLSKLLSDINGCYERSLSQIMGASLEDRAILLTSKAQIIFPQGMYLISQAVARELLCIDEFGFKKKTQYGGTHSVTCLHQVFYKPNPDRNFIFPTSEHAVVSMLQLLEQSKKKSKTASATDLIKIRFAEVRQPYELFELAGNEAHELAYKALQSSIQENRTVSEFLEEHPEQREHLQLKTTYVANTVQAGLGVDGILLHDLLAIYSTVKHLNQHLGFERLLALYDDYLSFEGSPNPTPQQINELLGQFSQLMSGIDSKKRIREFANPEDLSRVRNGLELFVRVYGFQTAQWIYHVISKFPELSEARDLHDYKHWLKGFRDIQKILPKLSNEERLLCALDIMNLFDLHNFTCQTVNALVSRTIDGKSDNYMAILSYNRHHKIKRIYISGIDNDKAMDAPIEAVYMGPKEAPQHFAGIKCILFLLNELLDQPISERFVKRFTATTPVQFMLDWLTALGFRETQYQHWINRNILDKDDLEKDGVEALDMPFKLSVQQFNSMLESLTLIMQCFQDGTVKTHRELFHQIHPVLADYYHQVSVKVGGDPQRALSAIYLTNAQFSLQNILGSNYFVLDSRNKTKVPLSEYLNKIKIIDHKTEQKLRDQTLNDMVTRLLANVNWMHCLRDEDAFLELLNQTGYLTHVKLPFLANEKLDELIHRSIAAGYAGAVRVLIKESGQRTIQKSDYFHTLALHYNNPELGFKALEYITDLIVSQPSINLNQRNSEGVLPLFTLMEGAKRSPDRAAMILRKAQLHGLVLWFVQENSKGQPESPLVRAMRIGRETGDYTVLKFLIRAGFRADNYSAFLFNQFMQINPDMLNESIPDQSGLRADFNELRKHDAYFDWGIRFSSLFDNVAQRGQLSVVLPGQVVTQFKGPIDQNIRSQLSKILKFETNEACFGRHYVLNIDDVYFKFNPESPGIEEAVRSLCSILFGWGTAQSQLARLNVSGVKHPIPVLLSKKVEGKNLQTALKELSDKEVKELLAKIDPESFSEAFIKTLLINPEDEKPDNFILESFINSDGEERFRLVCVDNDHAFVEPFKYVYNKKEGASRLLQIKSFIYCLDNMRSSLHPDVVSRFIRLPIYEILQQWVHEIANFDSQANALFSNKEQKQLADEKSPNPVLLGVPLPPNTIGKLYDKMQRLQTVLRKNPNLTALELLEEMQPSVGYCYSQAFTHTDSPKWRFFFLMKDLYLNSTSEQYCTMTTVLHLYKSQALEYKDKDPQRSTRTLNERLTELDTIAAEHSKLGHALTEVLKGNFRILDGLILDASIQKILNQVNYSKLKNKANIKELLAKMVSVAFTELTLRNADFLSSDLLIKILKQSPDLKSLVLLNSGSDDLSKPLSSLTDLCLGLKTLTIVDNNRLSAIAGTKSSGFLNLPNLEALTVIDCPSLAGIKINTSNLRNVVIDNSPQIDPADVLILLEKNKNILYFCINLPSIKPQRLAYFCALYSQWHDEQLGHLMREGGLLQSGVLRLDGLPVRPQDVSKILDFVNKMSVIELHAVNLAELPQQLACFSVVLHYPTITDVILQNPLLESEQGQQNPVMLSKRCMIGQNTSATKQLIGISGAQFLRIPQSEKAVHVHFVDKINKPIKMKIPGKYKEPRFGELYKDNEVFLITLTGILLFDVAANQLVNFKPFARIDTFTCLNNGFVAVSRESEIFIVSPFSKKEFELKFKNLANGYSDQPLKVTKLLLHSNALYIGSEHHVINVYDLSTRKFYEQSYNHDPKRPPLKSSIISDLIVFPDGTLVSCSDTSTKINAWNTNNMHFTLSGHTQGITSLAIVKDNYLLSGSLDRSIRLWDIYKRTQIWNCTLHSSPITGMIKLNADTVITSDGNACNEALFGVSEFSLRAWNIHDLRERRDTNQAVQLAFLREWNEQFACTIGQHFIMLQWPQEISVTELELRYKQLGYVLGLFKSELNVNNRIIPLHRQILIRGFPESIALITNLVLALKPDNKRIHWSHYLCHEFLADQNIPLNDWLGGLTAALHCVDSQDSDTSSEEEMNEVNQNIAEHIDLRLFKRCKTSFNITVIGEIVILQPKNDFTLECIKPLELIIKTLGLTLTRYMTSTQITIDFSALESKSAFRTMIEVICTDRPVKKYDANNRMGFWSTVAPSAPQQSIALEGDDPFKPSAPSASATEQDNFLPSAPEMSQSEHFPVPSAPEWSYESKELQDLDRTMSNIIAL